jgi:hypothetical protein
MLIKVNVSGCEYPLGHGIIAPIAFSVSRVTEENAWNGARSEFMRCGGDGAGVTTASENPKTIVGWRRTIKEMVRRVVPSGTTWTKVNEEGGGG